MIDIDSEQEGVDTITALQLDDIDKDRDCVDYNLIGIIKAEELLKIIKSFKMLIGDSSNYSYKFNVDKIIKLYQNNMLLTIMESHLFHIIISHNLIKLYDLYPLGTTVKTTSLVNLHDYSTIKNYRLMSITQITDFIRFRANY